MSEKKHKKEKKSKKSKKHGDQSPRSKKAKKARKKAKKEKKAKERRDIKESSEFIAPPPNVLFSLPPALPPGAAGGGGEALSISLPPTLPPPALPPGGVGVFLPPAVAVPSKKRDREAGKTSLAKRRKEASEEFDRAVDEKYSQWAMTRPPQGSAVGLGHAAGAADAVLAELGIGPREMAMIPLALMSAVFGITGVPGGPHVLSSLAGALAGVEDADAPAIPKPPPAPHAGTGANGSQYSYRAWTPNNERLLMSLVRQASSERDPEKINFVALEPRLKRTARSIKSRYKKLMGAGVTPENADMTIKDKGSSVPTAVVVAPQASAAAPSSSSSAAAAAAAAAAAIAGGPAAAVAADSSSSSDSSSSDSSSDSDSSSSSSDSDSD